MDNRIQASYFLESTMQTWRKVKWMDRLYLIKFDNFESRMPVAIPPEHIQERLHEQYIQSILPLASAKYIPGGSDYGTDGYIQKVKFLPNGKPVDTGDVLPFQAKASVNCRDLGDEIAYAMKAPAYNKLIQQRQDGTSIFLILYQMPKQQEWVVWSPQRLVLQTCCYYWIPPEDAEETDNTSSKTIRIPKEQTFTPIAVRHIFQSFS